MICWVFLSKETAGEGCPRPPPRPPRRKHLCELCALSRAGGRTCLPPGTGRPLRPPEQPLLLLRSSERTCPLPGLLLFLLPRIPAHAHLRSRSRVLALSRLHRRPPPPLPRPSPCPSPGPNPSFLRPSAQGSKGSPAAQCCPHYWRTAGRGPGLQRESRAEPSRVLSLGPSPPEGKTRLIIPEDPRGGGGPSLAPFSPPTPSFCQLSLGGPLPRSWNPTKS